MMPSSAPRKSLDPTVTDLENDGRNATSRSSLTIEETGSSQSHAQESRRSAEVDREENPNVQNHSNLWWKKIEARIPAPVAKRTRQFVLWTKGPEPPRIYRIKPYFEPVQTFPIRLLSRLPKKARGLILFLVFLLWVVVFGVILSKDGLPSDIAGYGSPVKLSCTNRLWYDPQDCGLDGTNCLPFDNTTFAFSCPADCASVQVLNPYTIGDESIVYRSLVVGGTPNASESNDLVYRGDSFICGAAVHAGVINNNKGGCGVISLIGERSGFGSVRRNGILSVGFEPSFPLSIDFDDTDEVRNDARKCSDPRWKLLILSVIITVFISLFTTSPAPFFVPMFIIAYFQIAMASDPPSYSTYAGLASTAIGRFLPAAFVGVFIYRFTVRKTLNKLTAQIEKTVLWLGALWVGALDDYTLENIPLQRLTPHDLHQQPGAITALVFIVIIIFVIAVYQAWCYRNEGRLLRYLALYATLGIGLLICLAIPGLSLRIHHYILALLLLPGTSLQTRPSLLYQGLLVGLFINGIARWGFDSILQTAASLQGDALLDTGVPSIFQPNITASNITFSWEAPSNGWDGISVLVNDVERFRGFHADGDTSFTWERSASDQGAPEFFRFGFVNYVAFGGVTYSDFTKAGTWFANGTWGGIPAGAT